MVLLRHGTIPIEVARFQVQVFGSSQAVPIPDVQKGIHGKGKQLFGENITILCFLQRLSQLFSYLVPKRTTDPDADPKFPSAQNRLPHTYMFIQIYV